MPKDNSKIHSFLNIVYIGLIFLVLLAGLIVTLFAPDDINNYENRYANKIISPTLNSYLDNSFQSGIESALSDQIPFSQTMKKSYNEMMSFVSKKMLMPIIDSNRNKYISYKNGIGIFNGHYVYYPSKIEYLKPLLDKKAENYNLLFKKYPDIDFYVYYIQKDTDINFETDEKLNADNYLFSQLKIDNDKKSSFEIDSFNDFLSYFYKTDHHWKHTGSYKAYTDIIGFLNIDEVLQKGNEIKLSDSFMGSKSLITGSSLIDEPFYVYNIDYPDFVTITCSQQNNDYGYQNEYIINKKSKAVTYSDFYGADDGEVIFDSGNTNLDNILIIGESYDNAILKMLATHFNKTYSIDLRNYKYFKGNDFDFGRYISDNDIKKVLFIGNIDFYISDVFNVGDN